MIMYNFWEPTPEENVRETKISWYTLRLLWYSETSYFSYVNDELLILYWSKVKEKWDHLQYWNSLIILLNPREVPVKQIWNSYYVKLKWLLQFQQIIRKK